jgi:hypothetical protein
MHLEEGFDFCFDTKSKQDSPWISSTSETLNGYSLAILP